jgi:hypothetical protein
MARRKHKGFNNHKFSNKLLLNQWLISLFGKNIKKNENAWYKNRLMLCEKGFTFEYSATFEQSLRGTGHEDDYAKSVEEISEMAMDLRKYKYRA